MNALAAVLALMCGLSVLAFAGWQRCQAAGGQAAGKGWPISGLGALLTATALAAYLAVGHVADWQNRVQGEQPDPRAAARLTELREAAARQPNDLAVRTELAQAYIDSDRFREAIRVLDECLAAGGPKAGWLGMKAFAMYYRDSRQMQAETRAVVEEALRLNPLEVQTRMLLGQDAFLKGKYEEAISHWTSLLKAGVAPEREKALRNAITNAQRRMSRAENN